MQAPALTRDRLRALCRERADGGAGLSLVFDLDPERFATPPARKSEITSVLDGARRRVEEQRDDRDRRTSLRKLVGRAYDALADPTVYDGCHGLALFAGFDGESGPSVLRLPRPAGPDLDVDTFPLVRPLLASASGRRWAVALVSREEGRILLGDRFRLEDAQDLRETAHGRHDQGGWSQARYQRAVDEEAREHFDRVAAELERMRVAEEFDCLLIGGTEENTAALRDRLADPVARVTSGTLVVDVQNTNADEVLDAARGPMEASERQVLEEDFDRLRQQLGSGNGGAMGLEPTLEALTGQRVGRLFAPATLDASGTRCPHCDRISSRDERECPLDGTPLVRRPRILDDAVRKACGDSAEVSIFETAADIPGGIAALTRY
jgi:peptide subunit release factor 1 (eRF1)